MAFASLAMFLTALRACLSSSKFEVEFFDAQIKDAASSDIDLINPASPTTPVHNGPETPGPDGLALSGNMACIGLDPLSCWGNRPALIASSTSS